MRNAISSALRIARRNGTSGVETIVDLARRKPLVRIGRDGLVLANDSAAPYHLVHSAEKIQRLADTVTAQDRVVFDVGAHSGLFAGMVKRARPDARVVCVEPDPSLHPAIRHNLDGFEGWQLIEAAMSDRDGEATLYRNPASTQTNSLLRASVESFATDIEETRVKTRTIDSVADELGIERIDVLKLDIQGAESLALDGARRSLSTVGRVLIEVSFLDEDPAGMLVRLQEKFGRWTVVNPVAYGADLMFAGRDRA